MQGGVLVHLPGSMDPNTDVLFNMQTRRVEELVYLAGVCDRWCPPALRYTCFLSVCIYIYIYIYYIHYIYIYVYIYAYMWVSVHRG